MKKINPDIFDVFSLDGETSQNTTKENTVEISPYLAMGFVLRSISVYNKLSSQYSIRYPEKWKDVQDSIKKSHFISYYSYLLSIDLSKASHVSQCVKYGLDPIISVLNCLLSIFEEWEYYEYCQVIKQYLDFFKMLNDKDEIYVK